MRRAVVFGRRPGNGSPVDDAGRTLPQNDDDDYGILRGYEAGIVGADDMTERSRPIKSLAEDHAMTEPTLRDVIDRLDRIDGRLDRVEQRLDRVEQKVDVLSETVAQGFASLGVREVRRVGTGDD